MVNKSGAIGTRDEGGCVRVLKANGFPQAERRRLKGAKDEGDLTCGDPRLCWEVKGGNAAATASDNLIVAWLNETETERVNARAEYGILVVKRKGISPANAERWWAITWAIDLVRIAGPNNLYTDLGEPIPVRLHLGDMCRILAAAGYGQAA